MRGDGADAARAAMQGVELEDGLVMPRDVSARRVGRGVWELDDHDHRRTKTREVRRLCEALGLEVDRLVRTKFGPVKLGIAGVGQDASADAARKSEIICRARRRAAGEEPRSRLREETQT